MGQKLSNALIKERNTALDGHRGLSCLRQVPTSGAHIGNPLRCCTPAK